MNLKAQISIETLFGLGVVLLLLFVVFIINFSRADLTEELEVFYGEANECNELALTISVLYSEGPFSKAEFSLDHDFSVERDYVLVGSTRCDFVGIAQPATLSSGEILAKNISGVVVLENK